MHDMQRHARHVSTVCARNPPRRRGEDTIGNRHQNANVLVRVSAVAVGGRWLASDEDVALREWSAGLGVCACVRQAEVELGTTRQASNVQQSQGDEGLIVNKATYRIQPTSPLAGQR